MAGHALLAHLRLLAEEVEGGDDHENFGEEAQGPKLAEGLRKARFGLQLLCQLSVEQLEVVERLPSRGGSGGCFL